MTNGCRKSGRVQVTTMHFKDILSKGQKTPVPFCPYKEASLSFRISEALLIANF
jgi:hypothetical protein